MGESGKAIAARLKAFQERWLSNPAAMLEFIKLIETVHVTTEQYAIIRDSAEWSLVKDGTCLVEFYHCADKAACTARVSAKLDERQSER